MLGAWNQRHRDHVGLIGHAGQEQLFLAVCTLMNQQRNLVWEGKQQIKAGTEMRGLRPQSGTEGVCSVRLVKFPVTQLLYLLS